MKHWLKLTPLLLLFFSACKDTSAPIFTSFKINGQDINPANPTFSGGINDEATFQIGMSDDNELLQLIAFIDTTGFDQKERLYALGLEGNEAFAQFTFTMRFIDSLSQQHFFGEATPIIFTVSDNNTNSESVTVSFSVN